MGLLRVGLPGRVGPLRRLALLLPLFVILAGVAAAPLCAQEAGGEEAGGAGAAGNPAEAATGPAGTAYLLLRGEIDEAEQALARKILGAAGAVERADVERLEELSRKARLSLHGDLIDRSVLLLILAEERLARDRLADSRAHRIEEIMASRELEERAARAARGRTAALWGSLGTGAASFAAAFTFWYLSEWQDEQYFQAATLDDAVKHRTYFKVFSLMSYLSAGVGVLSAGISIPLLAGSGR